jgi:hypothetical protein
MPGDWKSRSTVVEAPQATAPSTDWMARSTVVDTSMPKERPPNEIESAARGAFQGVTSFFGDELVGYAKALGKGLTGSSEPVMESIKKGRDENRAANQAAKAANPTAYGGGEMVGSVASSLLPQGKAAKLVAGTMGKVGPWAAAALTGGVQGAGMSEAETAGGIATDTGAGAALGVAGEAAGRVVGVVANKLGVTDLAKYAAGKVGDAAEWTANKLPKKLLAAIGGVKEEKLTQYLAEHEAVNAARPLTSISPEVANRMDALKNMVIEGSREATEKIPEQGQIPVADAYKAFGGILKEFDGAGGAGKAAKKAQASIQGLQDDFNTLIAKPSADGATVVADLRDIKKFIKAIDKEIKDADVRGTFMSPENVSKVALRREFDGLLKAAVPEYAAAMKSVAANAEALAAASAKFGRGDIAQTLKTVARNDLKEGSREALKGLSEKTASDAQFGKDILTEAQRRLVLESFYKDATNGSRGVNLAVAVGGGSMAALGSFLGIDVLMPTGAVTAVAAITGALRDAYGPQVTKKILDAYVKRGPGFRDAVNALGTSLMQAGSSGPNALRSAAVPILKQFPQVEEIFRNEQGKLIPEGAR